MAGLLSCLALIGAFIWSMQMDLPGKANLYDGMLVMDPLTQLGKQAVLVLSDFEDLSNKEIGEALGLTVPAVKARLHRARLFLRGQLAVAFGYSPT